MTEYFYKLLSICLLVTLLIVAAVAGAGWWLAAHGRDKVQAQFDAHKAAEQSAISKRNIENVDALAAIDKNNRSITEGYKNEIDTLRSTLAKSERLRRGPALCGGFAGTTDAESAARGNAPDPGAGVFSESIDRDFKTLMIEMGEAAATGRACQAFVRSNGMAS